MNKYVYQFYEGKKEMKILLGGKGSNLAEMTNIGLPVPPGFTITTDACKEFYISNKELNKELIAEILENIRVLEEKTEKIFGDIENPLLVSVRSGAPVSMPGMMDTILNLGLNDETVLGFAKATHNERLAYDSYRRLIHMFGHVVMDIPDENFEKILDKYKENKMIKEDINLTAEDIKEIVRKYKEVFKIHTGTDFPKNPIDQLLMAVRAVFNSWDNPRARSYRKINNISDDLYTAVNIQTMVFGNMGNNSATGVLFTRNPSTGDKKIYGEFLVNAQGEDVVAGIRTPQYIDKLKDIFPKNYEELVNIAKILEKHYKDMQDIEFTIENGKTYILQTRNGKRTAMAAVEISVDMVENGLIDKGRAVEMIDAQSIVQLLHPTFDNQELKKAKPIAKGLAASPGAATGKIYFSSKDVLKASEKGEKVILVRKETSPEDIDGMSKAEGFLTIRGGMTSHAAVVARQMGKCCVTGCNDIRLDEKNKLFTAGGEIFKEGDYISIDGTSGIVYKGMIKTRDAEISGRFDTILRWADEMRELGVWANADTPKDALKALEFGAEGIGLCRTEHMFFDGNRIKLFRKMIIANDKDERVKALENLYPLQKNDFYEIFKVMKEKPVVIRLLDPPLHEFLPHTDSDIKNLSEELDMDYDKLKFVIDSMKEFNPMLGYRGCRLGITFPEIYEMQTKAIIAAAVEIKRNYSIDVKPEIMVPLVGIDNEIKRLREIITDTANQIIVKEGIQLKYKVGTMIEIPRACIEAREISKYADFFSFGTNDLTQMTFGFSRDDADKFLNEYVKIQILRKDPFQTIDEKGVGKLMEITIRMAKQEKQDIIIGICGEHGGDPDSIDLCHRLGIDYVSCSPYKIPIARLAAAQAAIKRRN